MLELPALVFTCEHATGAVPHAFRDVIAPGAPILRTHAGYDLGAAQVGRALAQRFRAPWIAFAATRLLIDANRSAHHRKLWSEYTRGLPEERKRALASSHRAHWDSVRAALREASAGSNRVVHIAVHSFTPVLGRQKRRCDVGLLYDPARRSERALCARWQLELERQRLMLRVRRNYPYRGVSDGLPTALRKEFDDRRYTGIELELNQSWMQSKASLRALTTAVGNTLEQALSKETVERRSTRGRTLRNPAAT